jgi:hypothetical protein
MVHELPEFFDINIVIIVKADDAQACGGPPEVAPAPGEHTSLHSRLRWEEGEHMVQETVGEGADAVEAAHRRRTLALLPRRHPVEQATGAVGSARQEKIKRGGWRALAWDGKKRWMPCGGGTPDPDLTWPPILPVARKTRIGGWTSVFSSFFFFF